MIRLAICLCLIVSGGCSRQSDSSAVDRGPTAVEEDGGSVKNVDRQKAESYFIALGNVTSADEEEKLLSEFGEWLKEKGYAIKVEPRNGKHELSCPFFPPVTPWARHSFFNIKNLELLPHLENDGL